MREEIAQVLRSRATCGARSSCHQASDRPRLLPRHASSQRFAGAWPAYAHQCPHPQGPAQGRRSLKKYSAIDDEFDGKGTTAQQIAPQQRASQESQEERRRRHRARPRVVQQHDHHDHRSPGQCPVVGDLGRPGLQGFAQIDPVRGAGRRRSGRPCGAGVRREEPRSAHQGPRPWPRIVGARTEHPRHQHHLRSRTSRRFRTTAAVRRSVVASDARERYTPTVRRDEFAESLGGARRVSHYKADRLP